MNAITKIDWWLLVRSPGVWALAPPLLSIILVCCVLVVLLGVWYPVGLGNLGEFIVFFHVLAAGSVLAVVIWSATVWSRALRIPVDLRTLGVMMGVTAVSATILASPFAFGFVAERRLLDMSDDVDELLFVLDDHNTDDVAAVMRALPSGVGKTIEGCARKRLRRSLGPGIDGARLDCLRKRSTHIAAEMFWGRDSAQSYWKLPKGARERADAELEMLVVFVLLVIRPDAEPHQGFMVAWSGAHRSWSTINCAITLVALVPLLIGLSMVLSSSLTTKTAGVAAGLGSFFLVAMPEPGEDLVFGATILLVLWITAGLISVACMYLAGRTRASDSLLVLHLLMTMWVPHLYHFSTGEPLMGYWEYHEFLADGAALAFLEICLGIIALRRNRVRPIHPAVLGRRTPRALRR